MFEFELEQKHLPFFAKKEVVKVVGTQLHVADGAGEVMGPAPGASALGTWQVECEGDGIHGAYLVVDLTWGS